MNTALGKLFGLSVLLASLIVFGHVAYGMGKRTPAVGTMAADFSLTDLSGEMRSLSQYRGQIVLLNFWATWCKPCTTEMPAMQAQYDRLRSSGFVVLAINELEDMEKVREHIRTYEHTFPVLLDTDNRVANMYGVYGLPVSVFIDEHGRVQEYIKGGLLTEDRIVQVVNRIRSESAPRAASLN
jgi:peroxiredoxin